jgi:galactokinase
VADLRRATGPGRVNLIGDHTDYNDGLALPMAIDLGVSVEWQPADGDEQTLSVTSAAFEGRVELPIGPSVPVDPATVEPPWARLIAAMVTVVPPESGGTLRIDGTLPIGAGLSSSAALLVTLAEVFGATGSPWTIASVCREAEHRCGVPVGAMDPLVCAGGRRDHALLIDFAAMTATPVPLPDGADIVVVDSGRRRSLRDAPYAERVEECHAAAAVVGPLGLASPSDLAAVHDPRLRRRCRHVVTECARVRGTADAFRSGDLAAAGALMAESHRSLAEDFEVSTPDVDGLVDRLVSTPGVLGARLTGAGFGGCVVALCHAGALDPGGLVGLTRPIWHVVATDGTVARRSR